MITCLLVECTQKYAVHKYANDSTVEFMALDTKVENNLDFFFFAFDSFAHITYFLIYTLNIKQW